MSITKTVAWIGIVTGLLTCCKSQQPAGSSASIGRRPLDPNLVIALSQPEKTTQLTFNFDADIKSLPAELWTLTQLQTLNLDCPEKMATLPPEVGQLRLLEELTFDCGNGASMNVTLPEEIGNLTNLRVLRLHGAMDPREAGQQTVPRTRFKKLPEGIRSLTKLQTLDLGRNGLPHVPAEIASLENLEKLDLSFNQIHEIPEFINNLRRLRELSLLGNGGMNLPASMSEIKGLRVAAGNNLLDLKTQDSLRRKFPNITFDFENEYEDCGANEPVGGYSQSLKKLCSAAWATPTAK